MSKRTQIKAVIKRLPVIGPLATAVWSAHHILRKFPGSGSYWQKRYATGGTSGAGSYSRLAAFKADVINSFVEKHDINSVIEFGSGDGNQLKLAHYKSYIGFDVSNYAVNMCRQVFAYDKTKIFKHTEEYLDESADLSMSLDVIYHLVEDSVFDLYMRRLFKSAKSFVIIYSSNDVALNTRYGGYHIKHRNFTNWIEQNAYDWELIENLPNMYQYIESNPDHTSLSDFYFYGKRRS